MSVDVAAFTKEDLEEAGDEKFWKKVQIVINKCTENRRLTAFFNFHLRQNPSIHSNITRAGYKPT